MENGKWKIENFEMTIWEDRLKFPEFGDGHGEHFRVFV